MTITTIPQTYAGTRFRSRLEAEWALNLDALGVAWAYEPEAFTLPSGANYLPDFWLPELNSWLEVKGPGVGGLEKTMEFAFYQQYRPECRRHAYYLPTAVQPECGEGWPGCRYWGSDIHVGGIHTPDCCAWSDPYVHVMVGSVPRGGHMDVEDANNLDMLESARGPARPPAGWCGILWAPPLAPGHRTHKWSRLPQWMPR